MRLFLSVLLGIFLASGAAHAQQSISPSAPGGSFFGNGNEPLEPDQAFKLTVDVRDDRALLAQFIPAAGYYLYRHRINFSIEKSSGISIVGIELPPGEPKSDLAYGETRVFHQPFSAVVNLKRQPDSSNRLKLKATFQGCSEKGICYPPINRTFDLVLSAGSIASPSPATPAIKNANPPSVAGSGIAEMLANGSSWLAIGACFLAGVGLAFTPCVLPMIPILSGIIAGHGQTVTRTRGFGLSLSYVLGMAVTYALVGIAAALTGSMLTATLQNAWVLWSFGFVFVLLALSMFGLYELRMPAIIQDRANSLSHRLSGGKIAAVFSMGALSALIVSPCIAAPLAGALLYISQTGDVALGGTALFAMALGMGTPLLAIGLSAGTLLPKAGAWMDTIKRFFGILLLAMAVWIISPIIPMIIQMLLWATLLIISASFLRATDSLSNDSGSFSRFAKGIGLIALAIGLAILIGALSGSRDLLQPLAILRSGSYVEAEADIGFEQIRTLSQLEQRLRETDRPVMLDFYADWCVACKEMEKLTYRDNSVAERLQDMLLLQVDVTENTAEDQALLKRFGLFGPPGVIFFDTEGREIRGLRVVGYQPAETFRRMIDQAFDPANKSTLTFLKHFAPRQG